MQWERAGVLQLLPTTPIGCEAAGAFACSGWPGVVDAAARFYHGSCAGGLEVFCQATFAEPWTWIVPAIRLVVFLTSWTQWSPLMHSP